MIILLNPRSLNFSIASRFAPSPIDSIAITAATPKIIPSIVKIDSVLFIPIAGLHKIEDKNIVYLIKGRSFENRDVEVSAHNNDFVIIERGLKAGDRIALGEPTEAEQKSN